MLRRVSALFFSMLIVPGLACSGSSSKSASTGGGSGIGGDATGGVSGGSVTGGSDTGGASGGSSALPPGVPVAWTAVNSQPASWYGTQAAADVAANILYYQNSDGGWPKNVDMTMQTAARATSTIDNKATTTQLLFLAKVYGATLNATYLEAFNEGLDYLFKAQYENGGWPQVAGASDYKRHITFNDGAMTLVISLMDQIAKHDATYAFVDEPRVQLAAAAVEKGLDCILRCQYVRDGVKTGWCAQHDEVTLEPANARAYELISLSGQEGAGVLSFLMSIPDPSPEIVEAVQGAVRWFNSVKIMDLEVQQVTTPEEDVVAVESPGAGPIWARFYQLEDDVPFFCGRDGIKKYSLAEVEIERRTGYSWYGTAPVKVLAQYPAWQQLHSPDDDALSGP